MGEGSSWRERAAASRRLLGERAAGLADALDAQLGAQLEAPRWERVAEARVLVTGAGLAEGPARYMAGVMAQALGARARFVPLSALLGAPPPADMLIICSQGLSPNARLAMARVGEYPRALLITAAQDAQTCDEERAALAAWERAGGHVVRMALEPERGLLIRVIGPTVTCLVALQLIAAWGGPRWPLDAIPAAVRAARAAAQATAVAPEALLHGRLALVAAGEYGELCHGLRWKLLEGLWREVPPVFDVLQFAHGPLQGLFYHGLTLLALERAGDAALLERLERVLAPGRHQLVRLPAALPAPLSIFEHSAMLDWLVCEALSHTTRDLTRWPAQGQDGPLYGLSSCPRCDASPCRCAA